MINKMSRFSYLFIRLPVHQNVLQTLRAHPLATPKGYNLEKVLRLKLRIEKQDLTLKSISKDC